MIRPLLKKTKVYVTGGFRTAGGMVRAVEGGACDGVGIGRPLGAEPYLCKDILDGKITGAIENFVPLPQNTQATGTQLHQVGLGDKLIRDWSEEAEVRLMQWKYAVWKVCTDYIHELVYVYLHMSMNTATKSA